MPFSFLFLLAYEMKLDEGQKRAVVAFFIK